MSLPRVDATSTAQAVTVGKQAQLVDKDWSQCNMAMLFLSNIQSIMQHCKWWERSLLCQIFWKVATLMALKEHS